ncbi:MAG: hypothetical protein U0637_08035 [Phycisphaerales bacterium]
MTPTRLLLTSALAFSVGAPLVHAQEQQPQNEDPARVWRTNQTRAGGASQARSRVIRVINEQHNGGVTPTGAPGTGNNTTDGTTGTLPGGVTPIGSPNLNPGAPRPRLSASGVVPPAGERRAGAARFMNRAGLRAPQNFDLESNDTLVTATWDDVSGNEVGFVVQRSERQGNQWSDPVELRVNANTQSISDTPGDGLWAYRVAAVNAAGRSWYSPWKVVAAQGVQVEVGSGNIGSSPNTAGGNQPPVIPSVPGSVGAVDAGGRTAGVSWAGSATGSPRGYELERSPAFPGGIVRVDATASSYQDHCGAGQFSYRVRAAGRAGSSDFSAWVSVAVGDIAPASPAQLGAVDLGDHDRVRLTWTDNSDNEARFLLQRETRGASGDWGSLQTIIVSPNSGEQVDNPGPGEHRYRVSASNSVGQSAATEWVGLTIEPAPTPGGEQAQIPVSPSGLIVTDAGARNASVRWTDASDNEVAFEVERNPAFSGGRMRVGADQTVLTDVCGVGQFWYRVRAVNGAGASAFTDWVSVTVADTTPEAPSALSLSDAGDHESVTLHWSDNASNEAGFRIEHQAQSSGGWGSTRVVQALANAEQQTDQPGPGTHRYRVAALNATGVSAYTPWSTITVEAPAVDPSTLPPNAPSGVVASDQGNRRAGLAWNDNSSNESGFQLDRSPSFPGGPVALGADVTAYVDTSGSGPFSYRARAFNNAGYSSWSDWASVTVSETIPATPLDLSATDAGDQTHVALRWTDASFNEQGFRIERSTWENGAWQPASPILLSANTSSRVDAPGLGRHRYRIQSFNSGGDSGATDWVVVNVTDGWTPVPSSADTREVFVSSSLGNDANDGLTEQTPKRTIAAAFPLLRWEFPDHLRLRRGDVWVNEHIGDFSGGIVGAFNKRGRSATEPMVVYTYGDSPERPLVKAGSRPFGLHMQSGGGISNVWVMGVHFQASSKVPNTPDFNPAGPGGVNGISYYSEGANFLFEDLEIDHFSGGFSFVASNDASPIRNIVVRRCVVADAYSTTSHSQGLYSGAVDGLLVDECVFDHNGWHETVPEAESTIFNHNFYLNKMGRNVTIRNTISARAAATGIQMRGSPMSSINCLALANPLGITMGHGSIPWPTEFSSGAMLYNVVLDSNDIGLGNSPGTQVQPRGFGLTWGRSKNVTVQSNIIAHNTLAHGDEPGLATDDANDNVLAEDNIVYDWKGANGTAVAFRVQAGQPTNATHRDNVFVQPRGGRCVQAGVATPGGQWSDNAYYSTDPSNSGWFRFQTSPLTPAEWATRTGDTTAQMSQVSFPDPERTVGTYMASLGMEPTLDAFLREARKQSRTNWRPEFTAQAVNQYIREGFGMPEPTQGTLAGAGQ